MPDHDEDQHLAAQGDAPLLPGLAAALPVPVAVILGEGGRVAAANAAWNRLAARGGAATLDALFPRAAPVAAAALASGAASLSLRALAGCPAGEASWWDLDLVPHPDIAGALVVTAREVTGEVLARREEEGARAALHATGARLRLAQEAAGVGTWEWDADTDRLSWSPEQFRLHGMDPARDAPPGFDAWIAMVHPDDRPPLLAAAEGVVEPDGHYQVEFRLRLKETGEERWLLSRGRVMRRGPDGRPLRILGVNFDVTERRREAEAVREREERLRLAFGAAGIFAWDWDVPSGRVVWSEGAEALMGMAPGSFAGTVDAFRALVHPDDAPAVGAALGRALSGEDREYAAEFRMRRGDGSWRWTATRATVLRDAAGHPLRVVGVDHDVTERRAAEHARGVAEREAEAAARLRLALEAGGMGAWDWDIGTGIARWDALMEALTGLPAEGGKGDPLAFMDRIHPEDRPAVDEAAAAALAQGPGGTYEAEFRFRRADGEWRWFGGRGQVVAGGEGGALRLLGLNWDVTERRAAAAALEDSEARFRALVGAMPQVAFSAPPDGRTDFVNARWTEYSGQDPAAATGGGWAAAVHPEDRERSLATWEQAVRTGEPCTFEQRLQGADGGFRWFLTRAEPLRDGQGRILRWFGTCTDISAIVEAREAAARSAAELERLVAARTRALAEAAAELQAEMRRREAAQEALLQSQKLEALGQLTSGVAHDFNNLLAAIQGSFRLLRREVGAASPRAATLLSHGEGAADRGARLIGQLSAFARREPPQAAVTDPAALLDGVHELLCHTAGTLAQCRVTVEPGAWPVLVDPVRLETVLLNLAANARDAMPLGGEIAVSARNALPEELPPGLPPGRGFLRLSMRDAGQGMDADTLRRATEPFFTTKPRGMGTGLGLSSAHAFCAASDGALRLSSEPGLGTEVELFLPRASILADDGAAAAEARHGDATILLAEDDEALRPVTAALLRNLGYAVIEAPSAEAAATLAHGAPALDMLVTDVALGGVPGPVLAARLRAERPGLPVLFITGHGRAPALEGASVLPKPFAEADLARQVLRGLGRLPGEEAAPPPAGRLLARLRHPALRGALGAWMAARDAAAGALPAPGALDGAALPEAARDHAYLAEVQPTPDGAELGAAGFRFLHAGQALEARFGATLAGRVVGVEEADGAALTDTLGGSLGAAYRRCGRSRAPLLDYARFDLGDGPPEQVERLVLPLSADGIWVTHLLGVAVVTQGPPQGSA